MKLSLHLLFMLFISAVCAQGEANIWYFGERAGLDFNSGAPVALNDGALITNEGCATIADTSGQLLFYTDGRFVWDRNHNIMPNGTGLLGHPSSSQSAIIVPKPNDPNIYYIFTVDAWEGGDNGLKYSEVDMSLNSGNGDVTALKNITLNITNTEKISAVKHCNGIDYWVVSHDLTDNFMSYEVTELGVNTTPVISTVGSWYANPAGYLKISPDGTKLATAKYAFSSIGSIVEIFDFDAESGVISNPILLDIFEGDGNGAYGIEFSPNNEILYVGEYLFTSSASKVHQFDILFTDAIDIINSDTILYNESGAVGALQLGPDDRIYVSRFGEEYLDIIENPNTLGVEANYIKSSIFLGGQLARFGLPTFIQSTFGVGGASIVAEDNCIGSTSMYSFGAASTTISSYSWDFGDGNTSTLAAPTHTYSLTGTYTVSLTVTGFCSGTESFSKEITIHEIPTIQPIPDMELCDIENMEVDLSQFNNLIYDNEIHNNFTVSYYENLSDAESGINPLDTIYTLTFNPQTIYIRLENDNLDICYDIEKFSIKTYENCIIPQGISPNNDGVNDWFNISWLNAESIKIFNRYGLEVYSADNYKNEWGGQDKRGNMLPIDTYFYIIIDQEQKKHSGWVYINK